MQRFAIPPGLTAAPSQAIVTGTLFRDGCLFLAVPGVVNWASAGRSSTELIGCVRRRDRGLHPSRVRSLCGDGAPLGHVPDRRRMSLGVRNPALASRKVRSLPVSGDLSSLPPIPDAPDRD